MKCPRCLQNIHRAAEACPLCGFSLADADRMFGTPKRLGILTDESGVIRKHERERVSKSLQHVSSRFPQVFTALYTGSPGQIGHLRSFAFWLLNRSTFIDLADDQQNRDGILLCIDPSTKSATISFGYLLEPYLTEDDTFECLSRAHVYWLEGQYAEGAIKVLAHLEKILRAKSRKSGTIAKRWLGSQTHSGGKEELI